MGQHVGVAKAAHLLGINRHDLQRMIQRGDLHTFEGQVDIEELRERYPMLVLDEEAELERVNLIKRTAFSRRVTSTVLPDTDELEIQLKKRNAELAVARAREKKYRTMVEDLAQMLCHLQDSDDQAQKELVTIINRWLIERLEKDRV